jgi:hypothetical protein
MNSKRKSTSLKGASYMRKKTQTNQKTNQPGGQSTYV